MHKDFCESEQAAEETSVDPAECLIMGVNLVAGFGFAMPMARLLAKVNGQPGKFVRYFLLLIGIYLMEAAAFAAGMGTMVFSVGLAFVWGVVFGLSLREVAAPAREILRTCFLLSLYTCLPSVSFISLPLVGMFAGWDVLSVKEGTKFGIPGFVPWPFNTVLGLCAAWAIIALALKPVITTGEVSLFIHLREKPADCCQ